MVCGKETPMKRSILALTLLGWCGSPPCRGPDLDHRRIPHSQTSFAVKHLMVATVRGDFGKTTGTVEYDGKDSRA